MPFIEDNGIDDHINYQKSLTALKQAFDQIPFDSFRYGAFWDSPHREKWQNVHAAILNLLIEYDPVLRASILRCEIGTEAWSE